MHASPEPLPDRQAAAAYRALLALLRPLPSPALGALAQRLAAPLGPAQRAWLVQRAVQEGAADWLLARQREGRIDLAAPLLQRLRDATAQQTRRTLAADALRQALRPLLCGEAAPLLLLKGAAIEQRCYPPGVVRPCGDVDALADAADLAAIDAQLRRLGLACVHRDPSGRTIQYAGPAAGAALDLHLRLACPRRYPRYGSAAVAAAVRQRAVLLADGTRALAPADASLHLLVHLATGLGGDLRHLADADLWLQVCGPTPADLLAAAAPLGVQRAVRAALAWLGELPLGAVDRAALPRMPLADRGLAELQRRWAQHHYLRRGPVLPPPLLALTEALCVDFPRGAVGLAQLAVQARAAVTGR